MQEDNHELEGILARRAAPPSRPDLAERIIFAAAQRTQSWRRPQTLWEDFLGMFALPHPSAIAAAGIVLGLIAGIQAGDGLSYIQQDWTSFLTLNEGGWL